MPASTKTKVAVALGALDIARQLAKATSARQEAERDRMHWGKGFREDARHLASDWRGRMPDLEWGMPPWRRSPTVRDRLVSATPVLAAVLATAAAVVVLARWIAARDHVPTTDELARDGRVKGAVKVGSEAIDAGVAKIADGARASAVGTASAVAAGKAAVKEATVQRAKHELDERVVQPAKKKALLFGSLGFVGLTVYVIVLAVAVQLLVDHLS